MIQQKEGKAGRTEDKGDGRGWKAITEEVRVTKTKESDTKQLWRRRCRADGVFNASVV